MILNEKEVKTCFLFALTSLFQKNSILIKKSYLSIDEKINIQASILYQEYPLDIDISLDIDYHDNQLCLTHIQGKIVYLFLQFDVIKLLQQFNHEKIQINEDSYYIDYSLPIEKISLTQGYLQVELKEEQ